jgi:hypothetical protein
VTTESTLVLLRVLGSSLASPTLTIKSAPLRQEAVQLRFLLASLTLLSFESKPRHLYERRSASDRIVPDPQNGSRTTFPGERPARLRRRDASLGDSDISECGAGFCVPLSLSDVESGTHEVGPRPWTP